MFYFNVTVLGGAFLQSRQMWPVCVSPSGRHHTLAQKSSIKETKSVKQALAFFSHAGVEHAQISRSCSE